MALLRLSLLRLFSLSLHDGFLLGAAAADVDVAPSDVILRQNTTQITIRELDPQPEKWVAVDYARGLNQLKTKKNREEE